MPSMVIDHFNCCALVFFHFSTAKVVQGIFTLATFISYGLQCYVPVEIIWGNYLSKRFNGQLKWEFAVRITIVLITCKFTYKFRPDFQYKMPLLMTNPFYSPMF